MLPALVLSGLMLGALGLVLSSFIQQLENFAGVMNFVIFPMFFASSALYPLWRVKESSLLLWWVCQLNPFTSATELIRFALYGEIDLVVGHGGLVVLARVHGARGDRLRSRAGPHGSPGSARMKGRSDRMRSSRAAG